MDDWGRFPAVIKTFQERECEELGFQIANASTATDPNISMPQPVMQEDDDFQTPCPISASVRRFPKTTKSKIIRKCKNSPPSKRSKSSKCSKENVPPLVCKGESTLGSHPKVVCQPIDIPTDYSCSIESKEEHMLINEVADEAEIPPVSRSEPSEESDENVYSLDCEDEADWAFHRAVGGQPLNIPIDPENLAQIPSLPPINRSGLPEESEENVYSLDCEDESDRAFHRKVGGQPLNIPPYPEKPHSYSIESRLLRSAREQQEFTDEDEVADETDGDFESNPQLDLLIRLCSDANENGFHTCSLAAPTAVECPVCSLDISGLNEEARQLHTNACLDKSESPESSVKDDRAPQSLPETHRVVSVESTRQVAEWLRSLGLDKYEEAFTREEIDWDTLKLMTEEDLISVGVTALGPRKKIVQALDELRKGGAQPISVETGTDVSTVGNTKKLAASRLITDYFLGPGGNKKKSVTPSWVLGVAGKDQSHLNKRRLVNTAPASSRKYRDIPVWCIIPGTPFRVDAFKYLRRDCTHWFLSHFHADHYQGLTRSFCHGKIYCSMITARLVHMKIGIPWDTLEVLPLNQRVNVDGVHVTCFDANHCPGSVIMLFEPPNGKAVLHTGDFRFCEEMASLTALAACPIHTIILDTTYCNPQVALTEIRSWVEKELSHFSKTKGKPTDLRCNVWNCASYFYDFPKQEAIIQFVIEAIQAESFHPKTLFLIGSYTIGKERLFLEVARVLRKKIYVTAAKLRILECLELPKEDKQWLTTNEHESHIHVLPLWSLASFKRLKQLSHQYTNRFSLIVAFSPTGWSFGKGKKSTGRRSQQGTIIRYEVPYSEHSSFTELKQCVNLIRPVNIIPSVNNRGEESSNAMVSQLLS